MSALPIDPDQMIAPDTPTGIYKPAQRMIAVRECCGAPINEYHRDGCPYGVGERERLASILMPPDDDDPPRRPERRALFCDEEAGEGAIGHAAQRRLLLARRQCLIIELGAIEECLGLERSIVPRRKRP